ncbi:MAG: endo-1,4-beta-xylanase [Hellea sp.]
MKLVRVFLSALVLWVFCLAPPCFADDTEEYNAEGTRIWKMLPRASEMIRHPSPKGWEVYNVKKQPKTISTPEVPGGKALRLKVKKAGANPWDKGANGKTQLATQKGDVLLGAFWARAAKLPEGTTETRLPFHIQQMGDPYAQFKSNEAIVTSSWNQYFIYAALPKTFKKGGVGLAIHLSTAAHTIDLGPVYLMNMGPGTIDASAMPVSTVSEKLQTETQPVSASASQPATYKMLPHFQKDLDNLQAKLPRKGTLINDPSVTVAQVFGDNENHTLVDDAGVTGGKALEVTVKETGLNSWSTGVNWPSMRAVKKGDAVVLAFWAKGISAKNEAQTPIISPVRVQQSGDPYEEAASSAAYLSRDWKIYYTSGVSNHDIAPGGSGVSFHMGLTKQTLRLGPAYLINLGQGLDARNLPRNKVTYNGQEANAPWRAKAKANIEKYRKGNLTVKVTDASGNPVANANVTVEMVKHKFHFGSFVGHEFVKKGGEKNTQYHKSFNESFNMATLPLYWQDWGWNGANSFEGNYRETVQYAHKQGIAWRGHPIIWPGENYMPSRITKNKGKAKKQREQVLRHTREVMNFVKDYEPIAIDVSNEPRSNQYFKENGNPDLVADVFKAAHEIAPDIPLFINDYAILNNGGVNQKAIDFYHDWIRTMRWQDVPLGGIGFQGHFSAGLTNPKRIMEILEDFGQYGLPLHITEFDIETLDEGSQAAYTRDILQAAFASPALEAFIVWGWWEGDHWKPNAAMLREDWSEKPNYKAWQETIKREWWTRETGITNQLGQMSLRGFKGDYKVTVNGRTVFGTLDDAGLIEVKF